MRPIIANPAMHYAAAHSYLRYAATEPLCDVWTHGSLPKWRFLATSVAARLVAGPSARMTCMTTPTASRRAGLAPKARGRWANRRHRRLAGASSNRRRRVKARSPKMMPPMAVGADALTASCFCRVLRGAMTLRAGTSSVGREYRYYTCSTKARQDATGCPGITVPMDRLNEAVVDHL